MFQPTLKYLFPFRNRANRGTSTPPEILLQDSKSYFMQKEKVIRVSVSLCLEYEAPKFVKVKAHTRRIKGKVVKVRTHYRRVVGR